MKTSNFIIVLKKHTFTNFRQINDLISNFHKDRKEKISKLKFIVYIKINLCI